MSRYIDADKFAELVKRLSESDSFKEDCRKAYNSIYLMLTVDKEKYSPTAYDIEKVVAELEEMIKPKKFYFCKYAKGGCKHLDNDAKDCLECIVELSIDIVRKGGVNE